MIKINLVSEGRRPVVSRKTKERLGIAGLTLSEGLFLLALVVGAALIAGYWWYLRGEIRERDQAIAVAQKEVDELQQVLQEVEDYKVKKEKLEHKINIINDLKRKQWGPVRIMDQISNALPELLWLDAMTLQANNIELRGKAFNTNQIAAFIENLGKVPEFQEPRLRDTSKQGPVYAFTITFNFSIAEPPAAQQPATGEAPAAAAAPPAGT
ncbi:MAG TPA: PilN domain-containing protein [Thermoanaerobaculia bacterium]|jgi:Tfp pilus assembly protein PilN|nr:PilN domain-containing protein [Thermoanaerobaculia bacterium]